MKTCTQCGKSKDVSEFHPRGDGPGHRSKCKECYRVKLLAYYDKNKDQYRESEKRYRKRHPEKIRVKLRLKKHRQRARLRNLTEHHTEAEWQAVLARYGNRCLYCRTPESLVTIVRDHVIPLSRGGSNRADNLQPLCEKCNTEKGTTTCDFRR